MNAQEVQTVLVVWLHSYKKPLFLGTLERRLESMQWRFRRRKKSTKLSFTQFAADFVELLPCWARTRGCRRAGRAVRPVQMPDSCVLNSHAHRLRKRTKFFLSCYANRRKTIYQCASSPDSWKTRVRPSFTWSFSSPRGKVRSLRILQRMK